MLQTSIATWLKKPTTVTQTDASRNHTPTPLQPALSLTPHAKSTPTIFEEPTTKTPNASTETRHSSSSKASSLPPLPRNVKVVQLTEDLIPAFKRLNSLTLPVPYPPSFYTETMTEPHHSITLMALWHSKPPTNPQSSDTEKPLLVGAIRCRILPSSILYISTLCLLSPYRSHGIATHLLQKVVMKAAKEHNVKSVTAHVWEANYDALKWYKKRGFEVVGKEEGYYRKLMPSGAILVRKVIGVGDFLSTMDA